MENDKRMIGNDMYEFCRELFPICRSITGEGVRETLSAISNRISSTGFKLEVHGVPSGTIAFDWTVPKEWKIREAYIENENRDKIIDFKNNNLHVVGYSTAVDKWVDLEELKEHIYTQMDQPDVIPYVTSYYTERYGFCMSERQKNSLKPGKYHIFVDSELFNGELNYAEVVIPGESEKEIFFSTYICHPSMANNECSGPVLATELIRHLAGKKKRRYTYRFVFAPETIGAITYLSQGNNVDYFKTHMIAGFNLSCVGDNNDYSIIRSLYGDTLADKVLMNILKKHTQGKFSEYSFLNRGSDERQYNAPGIQLPVVCFCRTKFGKYPEYHTSADNMDYVSPEGFQGSFAVMCKVIDAIEYNRKYRVNVLCEPQLGKRGLYPTISQKGSYNGVKAMRNFIAYSDGRNDLIDVSNLIDVEIDSLISVINELKETNLLSWSD